MGADQSGWIGCVSADPIICPGCGNEVNWRTAGIPNPDSVEIMCRLEHGDERRWHLVRWRGGKLEGEVQVRPVQ
jgi:hypothetical protein